MRINDEEASGDTIVLSQPESVHAEQAELLVGAKVAGQEATDRMRFAGVAFAVHRCVPVERQIGLLRVTHYVESQLSVIAEQIAQIQRLLLATTVNVRRVQIARNLQCNNNQSGVFDHHCVRTMFICSR